VKKKKKQLKPHQIAVIDTTLASIGGNPGGADCQWRLVSPEWGSALHNHSLIMQVITSGKLGGWFSEFVHTIRI